jgi:hypothetical protein
MSSAVVVLMTCCFGYSQSPNEPENIEWQDAPAMPELPPEVVENMINRVAESDPQLAEQLKQLSKQDQQEFMEVVQKHISENPQISRPMYRRNHRPPNMQGRNHRRDMTDRLREMYKKHEEYIDWLKENYTDHYEQLQQNREENPVLYLKKLKMSVRKYGDIYRESQDNPELAELLKKDLQLKDQRDVILSDMPSADKEQKEKLQQQLKKIISKRYDLIVERKQIEYEKLLERLEQLKEKVKQSKTHIEKWQKQQFKSENINARLEELISQQKTFKWN